MGSPHMGKRAVGRLFLCVFLFCLNQILGYGKKGVRHMGENGAHSLHFFSCVGEHVRLVLRCRREASERMVRLSLPFEDEPEPPLLRHHEHRHAHPPVLIESVPTRSLLNLCPPLCPPLKREAEAAEECDQRRRAGGGRGERGGKDGQ